MLLFSRSALSQTITPTAGENLQKNPTIGFKMLDYGVHIQSCSALHSTKYVYQLTLIESDTKYIF
jgi:hypothetical protein